MIKLENKTGVQAPDGTYPFGKSLDRIGSTNGFPLNSANLEDYHQFFAKMFDESGVVANGLPDNDVNGWQLFEALLGVFGGVRKKVIPLGPWNMDTTASLNNVTHGIDYMKIVDVRVFIHSDAPVSTSLPSYVPDGILYVVTDSPDMVVSRGIGGPFDGPDHSSVLINRGYVVIDYLP